MTIVETAGPPGTTPNPDGTVAPGGTVGARATLVWHYQQHYAGLVRLGCLLTGDRHVAEDLVHDAFERLYRRDARLAEPERVGAYLRTTVVNLARGRHRRRLVALRHPEPPPGAERSAEDAALGRVDQPAVLRALLALPDRQRECVVLRHWLRMTEGEIAATLGLSVGAVRTHTHRGHRALSAALDDPGAAVPNPGSTAPTGRVRR